MKRLLLLMLVLCLTLSGAMAENAKVVMLQQGESAEALLNAEAAWLEVYFPTVKGADACILRMGDEVIVVDAATSGQYPKVREVLAQLGIERVDTAFNTHPHDDHIQGFQHMPSDVAVGRFLYTFPEDANNNMKNALSIMKEMQIPAQRVADGETMKLGEAELMVIQREQSWFSDNNRSAMVKVIYGDCSLLLAADVELDAQNMLLNTTPELLKADILKYPHHGVVRAGWNFLKHVGAELAIVTNGRWSVKNTREDAKSRHLPLLFTDEGVVSMVTDGTTWVVSQQLKDK